MISRRALAAALAKTGFLSFASGKTETRNTEDDPRVLILDSFETIRTTIVPPSIVRIVTNGYSRPGVGAASYFNTPIGKPSRYCTKTANGRWFELSPENLYVEKFGAIGNDQAYDDYPAIASAIEYIERRGGGVLRCDGAKTYYIGQSVKLNPTLTSIDAEGATWAFTQGVLEKPVGDNLLLNGDFSAGGTGWISGSQRGDGSNWRFAGGKAIFEPSRQESKLAYFEQKVHGLKGGERVSISLVLETVGPPGTKAQAPFSNPILIGLKVGTNEGADDEIDYSSANGRVFNRPGIYHFSAIVPVSNGAPILFTVAARESTRINYLGLQRVYVNPCVRVSVTEGSTMYGQTRRYCRGLRIEGPRAEPDFADGMLFETDIPSLSSRWALYSCEFAVNLRRALVFGSGAYLLQAFSSRFSGVVACLDTLVDARDAGESIDFFGCTFDNGGVGISNPAGMEIKLFGGAIDYCQQFYVGGGEVSLFGTHLEMSEPQVSNEIPIVLIGSGDFYMKGGTLLVTPAGKNNYLFFGVNRFSRVILQDVDGYGWPAASGELMGGAGRLLIDRIWWGPNHNITAIPKRDALHSIFGKAGQFGGDAIGIGCAVSSRLGMNEGPHLTRYANGQREFSARLELSRDYAHSGRQSLKFSKTGWGMGSEAQVLLYAPVERRRMISCEFWYACSAVEGLSATASLWFTLYFAQISGFDAQRVPIIGEMAVCQEVAVNVRSGGAEPEWRRILLSSTYADQTSYTDGYGADWTSHMLVGINAVEMPSGFVLYLDDLYGFSF